MIGDQHENFLNETFIIRQSPRRKYAPGGIWDVQISEIQILGGVNSWPSSVKMWRVGLDEFWHEAPKLGSKNTCQFMRKPKAPYSQYDVNSGIALNCG